MSSPVVASQVLVWERRSERVTGGAKGRWVTRNGSFLRLVDAAGRVGLGEASPLPGYSKEGLAACVEALQDVHAWCSDEGAREVRLRHLPAAQFALESALVDLEAKALGVSAAEMLGGATNGRRVALAGFAGAAIGIASPQASAPKLSFRVRIAPWAAAVCSCSAVGSLGRI